MLYSRCLTDVLSTELGVTRWKQLLLSGHPLVACIINYNLCTHLTFMYVCRPEIYIPIPIPIPFGLKKQQICVNLFIVFTMFLTVVLCFYAQEHSFFFKEWQEGFWKRVNCYFTLSLTKKRVICVKNQRVNTQPCKQVIILKLWYCRRERDLNSRPAVYEKRVLTIRSERSANWRIFGSRTGTTHSSRYSPVIFTKNFYYF